MNWLKKIIIIIYLLLLFGASIDVMIAAYPFIIEKNLPSDYYKFPEFQQGYLRSGKFLFFFGLFGALVMGILLIKTIKKILKNNN